MNNATSKAIQKERARVNEPYLPCDDTRPHERNCVVCHDESKRIHHAAEVVRAVMENAADLVMAALEEGDRVRQTELLNAVTIVLEAGNTRLGMDIIEQTFSAKRSRGSSISDGRSLLVDCGCQDLQPTDLAEVRP